MSFKIKDSLQVGTAVVINSSGELVTPKIKDAGSAFNSALLPTTLTGNQTITIPDATGTLALTSNIITPGAGALTVGTGAAAATNVAVTLTLSASYNANSSTSAVVYANAGPALGNLAAAMGNATVGFLKKTAADTYSFDSSTYLTAEADTLATVTSRGNTTSHPISTTNATAASTSATGALIVTGGAGIGGNLYVGTNANITGNLLSGNANLGNLAKANFFQGDGYLLSNLTITAGSSIVNGTSNVSVAASGNVTVGVAGNASIVTVTGTGANVSGTLNVTGNTIVGGNLWVNGTTQFTNVTTLSIVDPIIELGGGANGAVLGSNDGKDRGTLLHYYTTVPVDAYMGWDNSNGEFAFGSNVSIVAEVATFNTFGNVRAAYFLGNGSQLTGLITNSISNGTSNVSIVASGGNVNTSVGGSANVLVVTTAGANITGSMTVTSQLVSTVTTGTAPISVNSTTLVPNLFAANATFATTAGSVTTAAQGNITSLGTLTGLTSSGVVNVTNATDTTSNITGALIVTGGVAVNKNLFVQGELIEATTGGISVARSDVTQTVLATVSVTPIDTWAIASYRSVKYVVQITQSTNYQVSEVIMVHNGTTTSMTEYGVIETNGALATLTSDITGGTTARLLVTMGSATSATVNVSRIAIVV